MGVEDDRTAPARPGVARAPAARLAPGATIAGRWRVVRFVAEGGMGEVYEAEDSVLRDRVALKTIRGDAARDETALERFRREIQLARKVTHPNVCRLFDVGFQESGDLTFLTMELLEGETLAERLRGRGPLSAEEALPLVEQMAAGLQAAHDVGVLHRDFKSSNVLVGPRGAVITDFGLARTTGGDDRVTATGGIVGTPAYMAPEQILGGELTPAADVYAFGVVLYEMVTGDLPFQAESAMGTAMKRLKEKPPSPRRRAPSLPRAWEETILRCLEPEPADRFARPMDVVAALRGAAPASRRRRWPLLAAIAVLLSAAVGAGALALRGRGPAPAASVVPAGKHTVAVLGFRNLSGSADSAWISTALGELLATELDSGPVRVVSGEAVARARQELKLPDTDGLAKDTLGKVKASLGVDYVVLGSYLPAGGRLRVDVRVQDTASGETLLRASETGAEGELPELSTRVARRLRQALGAGAEGARGVAALPSGTDATRAYVEGLAKLRVYECQAARNHLEQAVIADGAFVPARSALAQALICLGYDERARAEATRALELGADLPAEDKALLEARVYSILGPEKQREALRRRVELRPDDVETALDLVEVLTGAGDFEEAVRLAERVRKLPGGDSPRLDIVDAARLLAAGEHAASLAAARRARARAEANGNLALVSIAALHEGMVQVATGDFDAAREAVRGMDQVVMQLGDRDAVAEMLGFRVMIELQSDRLDEAERSGREILAIQHELGSYRRRLFAYVILHNVAWIAGDLEREARVLDEGRRDLATGPRGVPPTWEVLPAHLELARGDPAAARRRLEALEKRDADGGGAGLFGSWLLGDALLAQDDLPGARRRFADAQRRANEQGDWIVRSWIGAFALGVPRAEGAPAEVEQRARALLVDVKRAKMTYLEGQVTAALARALLAQGKADEARAQADAAAKLVEGTQTTICRLAALTDVARVRGDVPALEQVLAEATQRGLVAHQLEARLALAELEPRRAAALARDARARGYLGIARRARALAAPQR